MRIRHISAALLATLLLPAMTLAAEKTPHPQHVITTADGLQYVDLVAGHGPVALSGHKVTVEYVGKLTNGKQFDASADHGGTFSFPLGAGQVIRGWDEGVAGMHVGGKRRLKIPPELGYGPNGAGDAIPPNATLLFDVTLVGVDK